MSKTDKYVLSKMVMGRYERIVSGNSKTVIDSWVKEYRLKQYGVGLNFKKFTQKETEIEFILEWD